MIVNTETDTVHSLVIPNTYDNVSSSCMQSVFACRASRVRRVEWKPYPINLMKSRALRVRIERDLGVLGLSPPNHSVIYSQMYPCSRADVT